MPALKNALIIIYGATGDLTKRKLMPALYKLFQRGEIGTNNPILCIGRRQLTNEAFLEHCELDTFIARADQSILEKFKHQIHYQTNDFSGCTAKTGHHCGVCNHQNGIIADIEKQYETGGNRIFYLATPPELFESLASIIRKCGLLSGKGFKRIAFEKPFGTDLNSARELNTMLSQKFKETQIYRIDHYLGKALVQDILTFRFANNVFETLWDKNSIDNVQITVAESLGVESRGGYYDHAGAIRDMLQNHLMELFALVTMERPKNLSADAIRDAKTSIVKAIRPPHTEDVVVGQYQAGDMKGQKVSGYLAEANIPQNSKTETFAAVRLTVDNARWRGVPFYLRTGKRLREAFAEINIQLKPIKHGLFDGNKQLEQNLINIRIQPDTGISLAFNTKTPGIGGKFVPVVMDFCHHCLFAINTPEAYEALFEAILLGDQTIFTRWDTVEASWKYIDKVRRIAKAKKLAYYAAGTTGPKQSDELLKKRKHAWLNHSFVSPFSTVR